MRVYKLYLLTYLLIYVVYRHNRNSVGGGVAIFIKNTICSAAVEVPVDYRHIGLVCVECLQCFDTVGWAAGRASGL